MNNKCKTGCNKHRDTKNILDMYKVDRGTAAHLEYQEYRKSQLSNSMKRYIKYLEKDLGRKCRKIWAGQSKSGIVYLYSNFCVDYDKLIVTIGHYIPVIGWVPEEIGR